MRARTAASVPSPIATYVVKSGPSLAPVLSVLLPCTDVDGTVHVELVHIGCDGHVTVSPGVADGTVHVGQVGHSTGSGG